MLFARRCLIGGAILLALAFVATWPAIAQTSIDGVQCFRPRSAGEKKICDARQLETSNQIVIDEIERIAAGRGPNYRANALREHRNWYEAAVSACGKGDAFDAKCLERRSYLRIAELHSTIKSVMPEFVLFEVEREEDSGGQTIGMTVRFPRLSLAGVNFEAANLELADFAIAVTETFISYRRDPSGDDTLELSMHATAETSVLRPPGRALTFEQIYVHVEGRATGAQVCHTVDLSTGKFLKPEDVIAVTPAARRRILRWIERDLEASIRRNDGDVTRIPDLDDRIFGDSKRFCWRENALVVLFDRSDIGSRFSHGDGATIPYVRIKDLFRPNGPIRPRFAAPAAAPRRSGD